MSYSKKYNISRRINSVIQRYQLRRRAKEVSNLLMILIVVWFIGGSLTILSQYLFSPNAQTEYLAYYWLIFIEVTSGFDVGSEFDQLNTISIIISVIMLISGIIIGGLVSGQIITIIINATQRAGFVAEAPYKFKFIDPIIILGINNNLSGIISSFRKIDGDSNRDIIVIDPNSDELIITDKIIYKNVWHIKSNPEKKEYLKEIFNQNISSKYRSSYTNLIFKASIRSCRVIILPNLDQDNHEDVVDPETIQKAMEVETFGPDIYTILQLRSPESKRYLKNKEIDEWINVSDYSTKLIAQSALSPGVTKVYNNIMGGNDQSNENEMIRFSLISKSLSGLSFRQIKNIIVNDKEFNCILLGFCKFLEDSSQKLGNLRNPNYYLQINPLDPKRQEYFKKKFKSKSSRFNKDTLLNSGHENDLIIYFANSNIPFDKYKHIG